MERTLGQVAADAWYGVAGVTHSAADWQAVADAVVAEYESRRWRSIESAPKDGKTIFGWIARECRHIAYLGEKHGRDEGWYMLAYNAWCQLSHPPNLWTPISAPPKEASDAE